MKPVVINARNVNDALGRAIVMFQAGGNIERQECRPNAAGSVTLEHQGVVVTAYTNPCERVLFSPKRNVNHFFHFMEALWILAGRNDVDWLAHFNQRMREFSDSGTTFHGAYGYRLRSPYDQIRWAISTLEKDPASRRVTITIFNPDADQRTNSKDVPCNIALSFLIRQEQVHLTVYCRSNDMVWGAYGANVVQFSTILELVARCLGRDVGTYTQVSNSFHVYESEPTWRRLAADDGYAFVDEYQHGHSPYSLLHGMPVERMNAIKRAATFFTALETFMHHSQECMAKGLLMEPLSGTLPYFSQVAIPLFNAWQCYKHNDIHDALQHVDRCHARDWRVGARGWLSRTRLAQGMRSPM